MTRFLIYRAAMSRVLAETRGNYPAPLAALEAVRYGLSHGLAAGYRNEARVLGSLIPSGISKNLIHVFYLNESLKRDPSPSILKVSRAGVIGAVVMGGGIAQLFAERGIAVRMRDITQEVVSAGLKAADGLFRKRKIATPASKEEEAAVYRHLQNNINSWIASRGNMTKEEIDQKLKFKELWLTGADVKGYGFADKYLGE